jgi:ComF family protein
MLGAMAYTFAIMGGIAGHIFTGLRNIVAGVGELLLPACCAACNSPDVSAENLCEACNRGLLTLTAMPYCPRCGSTIGQNVRGSDGGCPGCPQPLPRFDRVVRLGPYKEPLRGIVRQLKYRRRETILTHLAKLLHPAVAAQTQDAEFDLILPVPMFYLRRMLRGFDHARRLAEALGGEMGVDIGDELRRVRDTPTQVGLPKTRRAQNVRGAFAVRPRSRLDGARILLVDDVTTTGATANEAARTLLAAGASRVTLVVVAKADPPAPYSEKRDA